MDSQSDVYPLNAESHGFEDTTLMPVFKWVDLLLSENLLNEAQQSTAREILELLSRLAITSQSHKGGLKIERSFQLPCSTDPAEALGRAHTQNIPEISKKIGGVVYTPSELARLIVNVALDELQYLPETVLDPACGSGIFLTEAFKAISKRSSQNGDDLQRILKSLHGIDIDQEALKSARAALLLEYVRVQAHLRGLSNIANPAKNNLDEARSLLSTLMVNLINDNFLIPSQTETPLFTSNNTESQTDYLNCNEVADIIIGNPPYGLSRDEKILPIEKRQLEIGYKDWLSGKIDKYQLFLAQSFKMLKPGGVCAMIVPTSWLGISSAKILRRRLLNSICKIISINYPAFNNQGVETAIVVFKKPAADSGHRQPFQNHQTNSIQLSVISTKTQLNRANSGYTTSDLEHKLLPKGIVEMQSDNLITRIWETGLEEIFNKLNYRQLKMGDPASPFIPLIALQAYALGKGNPAQTREMIKDHCYHVSSDQVLIDQEGQLSTSVDLSQQQTLIPYLEGGDVTRSGISWSGSYLIYGPNLAEYYTIERYTQPRILLREILAPSPHMIMACYTEEQYAYNRSILHILAKDSTQAPLLPGLALFLNSKLAALYLAIWGRKSQRRLFPKLLAEDLRSFPLPSDEILATLSDAYGLFYPNGPIPETNEEIDKVVLSTFGLSSKDVALIDQTLKSPLLRQSK